MANLQMTLEEKKVDGREFLKKYETLDRDDRLLIAGAIGALYMQKLGPKKTSIKDGK